MTVFMSASGICKTQVLQHSQRQTLACNQKIQLELLKLTQILIKKDGVKSQKIKRVLAIKDSRLA